MARQKVGTKASCAWLLTNHTHAAMAILVATNKIKKEIPAYQRSPRRITITLNWSTYQTLVDRSDKEGRSLSNLASYLLECSVCS